MAETRFLALLTEPHVEFLPPTSSIDTVGLLSARKLASGTFPASILEVEYAHAVAYFPAARTTGSDGSDEARGFVRGHKRELWGKRRGKRRATRKVAPENLQIGVAEPGGADADEELGVPDLWYGPGLYPVRFIVLVDLR